MIGFLTLFKREVMRYLKEPLDTIAPPTISTILYIFVFGVALGSRLGTMQGVPYIQFVLPGLIMMAAIINSFYNPAYSVFQSRWQGNIFDFLASPLSFTQMALAIILAGVLRGLIVALIVLAAAIVFTQVPLVHPLFTGLYLILTAIAFSSLGCIVGLWTKGWDGVNAVNTFLLDPLVFLGGVFYSLKMVRGVPLIEQLTWLNPFTYITGGFRYGMLGSSETNVALGLGLIASLALGLVLSSVWLFRRGWRLKS